MGISRTGLSAGLGVVARAQSTTVQTGITTDTDITNLSVTWTAVSGRRYLVEVWVPRLIQQTSAAAAELVIADNAGTDVDGSYKTVSAAQQFFMRAETELTGLSGTVTYKAQLRTSAGTIEHQPAATRVSRMRVSDIGAI